MRKTMKKKYVAVFLIPVHKNAVLILKSLVSFISIIKLYFTNRNSLKCVNNISQHSTFRKCTEICMFPPSIL